MVCTSLVTTRLVSLSAWSMAPVMMYSRSLDTDTTDIRKPEAVEDPDPENAILTPVCLTGNSTGDIRVLQDWNSVKCPSSEVILTECEQLGGRVREGIITSSPPETSLDLKNAA